MGHGLTSATMNRSRWSDVLRTYIPTLAGPNWEVYVMFSGGLPIRLLVKAMQFIRRMRKARFGLTPDDTDELGTRILGACSAGIC